MFMQVSSLCFDPFQEFPHENDTCYLAHCYPYSYTDLELYVRTMVDNPKTSQHVQKEVTTFISLWLGLDSLKSLVFITEVLCKGRNTHRLIA